MEPYGYLEAMVEAHTLKPARTLHDQQSKACNCFVCLATRERLGVKAPTVRRTPRQPWQVRSAA